MENENEGLEFDEQDQTGTENLEGQPEGTGEDEGQSVTEEESAGGEPTSELPGGMTPEQLAKSYKELQTTYGKTNEQLKALEQFGGVDGAKQALDYIMNDPEFSSLIEARSKGEAPVQEEYDEDTRRALELVEKIADKKNQDFYSRHVAPIVEKAQRESLDKAAKDMDGKYEGWREYNQDMIELAKKEAAQGISREPNLETMEELYLKAVLKRGDFEKVAAQSYQKVLAQKKKLSTDKPESPPKGADKKPSTLMESLMAAQKKHGVSLFD